MNASLPPFPLRRIRPHAGFQRTILRVIFLVATGAVAAESKLQIATPTVMRTGGNPTMLYAVKAMAQGDATRQRGDFMRCRGGVEFTWPIAVTGTGEYEVRLIYATTDDTDRNKAALHWADQRAETPLPAPRGYFKDRALNYERLPLWPSIRLRETDRTLTLELSAGERTDLRAVELVARAALAEEKAEAARATAARAIPAWLGDARHGLMFHWTSQSVGRDGKSQPFARAVDEFDVRRFGAMVADTGASYVIFTVGHAQPYCPAPLAAWEKHHPGKTTSRDLIAEMAAELRGRGIRLWCYFPTHVVAKTKKVDAREFERINREILTEFGRRYGDKVTGYWFDGWYQSFEAYPDVSFAEFFQTCKIGHPERMMTLNSWIYPPVTPWQDYWAGEVGDPVALPEERVFTYGSGQGLPYHALLLMEPYWVQERADSPAPLLQPGALSQYIRDCRAKGGLVTINIGIFQNGEISRTALEVMQEVRRELSASGGKP